MVIVVLPAMGQHAGQPWHSTRHPSALMKQTHRYSLYFSKLKMPAAWEPQHAGRQEELWTTVVLWQAMLCLVTMFPRLQISAMPCIACCDCVRRMLTQCSSQALPIRAYLVKSVLYSVHLRPLVHQRGCCVTLNLLGLL